LCLILTRALNSRLERAPLTSVFQPRLSTAPFNSAFQQRLISALGCWLPPTPDASNLPASHAQKPVVNFLNSGALLPQSF
jgi:hypothetical protein